MRLILFSVLLSCAPSFLIAENTDTWAFEPSPDRFSDNALLDLSFLNEDVAGQSGFVGRSPGGDAFILGDGTPVRFWAVNTAVAHKGLPALREQARFLAKRGVNMVRFHGQMPQSGANGGPMSEINKDERQRLWQLVSAMKAEGIYTTFSPYYPHAVQPEIAKRWSAPADSSGLSGLIYFDPVVQASYKEWLRDTLVPPNPYTGIALKDDPALAIVQMQNEDSLLFWTTNTLRGREAVLLAERFGAFLEDKYGSLERARAVWDHVSAPNPIGGVQDDWDGGVISLADIWFLTAAANPEIANNRMRDQAQFLTTLMKDWHREIARYLREEIGAQQLFNAGNWRTADDVVLDDLERFSYTAGDIIAVNRYVSRFHSGEHAGWAIVDGDLFREQGVLGSPLDMPITLRQPAGYPYIIPETLWVPPIWQQSEAPVLMAAYQSLTGIDISYWFSADETQWRQPQSANGYLPSVGKWVVNTPQVVGGFPAAALIFRRALIEQAEPVVIDHLPYDTLWSLESPLINAVQGRDPNRDGVLANLKSIVGLESSQRSQPSPYSFLAGPVLTEFGSDAKNFVHPDLENLIDDENSRVTSVTGQLEWDWGKRVVTLNAPQVQGVIGTLASYPQFDLASVTIQSSSAYASVLVVSMDDAPISSSAKLLVQVGSTVRPSGWRTKTADHEGDIVQEVMAFGSAPWQINEVDGMIFIGNTKLSRATVLDANGMALRDMTISRTANGFSVRIPKDALYMIVQ